MGDMTDEVGDAKRALRAELRQRRRNRTSAEREEASAALTRHLVDLATDVGLDADQTRAALEDGRYAADVQADIDQARAYGINGVPFFVLDGRLGVSGAQNATTFVEAITNAVATRGVASS